MRARAKSFSRRLPSSPIRLQLVCLRSVSLRDRTMCLWGACVYRRKAVQRLARGESRNKHMFATRSSRSKFEFCNGAVLCLRSINSLILFQCGRLSGRFASAGVNQAVIISSQSKCLSSPHQTPTRPCQWSARTRSHQPW